MKQHLSYQVMICGCFLIIFSTIIAASRENSSFSANENDEIYTLPKLNFDLNFRHYSGYLSSHNETYLHYWFFESQSKNLYKDPLVLWLDGGPGCSSLVGALTGAGPLTLSSNGTLTKNPFSWNANTNLLFLESPAGVGFSYQVVGDDGDAVKQNDTQTALVNYEALHSFYRKFPHLTENDLYLAGQSYAGIYIPPLAMLILEHSFPINFKGIVLGNPGLAHPVVLGSQIQYGHEHGLISNGTWENIVKFCCPSNYRTFRDCTLHNLTQQSFEHMAWTDCLTWFLEALQELNAEPKDIYNVKTTCQKRFEDRICSDHYEHIDVWLNRADVQKALNIRDQTPKVEWTYCSTNIFNDYVRNIQSVQEMVAHLLEKNIKILLYFGETDMVCNYIGAEWFLDDLNLTDHSRVQLRPWFYENHIAGYSKQYAAGLLYIKVLDAGHFVLREKPGVAAKIFNDFLKSTQSKLSSSSSSSTSSRFLISLEFVKKLFYALMFDIFVII